MRKYIFIGFLLILFVNCGKKSDLDCSYVLCAEYVPAIYRFTLTDKQTGENLLSGTNARYLISDIKLFREAGGNGSLISFGVDTANNIVSIITTFGNAPFYLRLKEKDYKLTENLNGISCCLAKVDYISLDGKIVCTSCSGIINLPVD